MEPGLRNIIYTLIVCMCVVGYQMTFGSKVHEKGRDLHMTKFAVDDCLENSSTPDNLMITRTASSLIHCAVDCSSRKSCGSLFYNRNDQECRLHGAVYKNDSMPSMLTQNAGFKYYRQACSFHGYRFLSQVGMFYLAHQNGSSWLEAETYCEGNHGRLAILNNAKKRNQIWSKLIMEFNTGLPAFWVGAKADTKGQFRWLNGKVVDEGWGTGEPRNNNTDCVLMGGTFTSEFDDFSCEHQDAIHALCECVYH